MWRGTPSAQGTTRQVCARQSPPAQEGLAQGILSAAQLPACGGVVMGLSPSAEAGARFVPRILSQTLAHLVQSSGHPHVALAVATLTTHCHKHLPRGVAGTRGVGALHLPAGALGCTVPGPGRQA